MWEKERKKNQPYSEDPVISHSEIVGSGTVEISVAKARAWELPLPTGWLTGETLTLSVTGLDERPIPNPPPAIVAPYNARIVDSGKALFPGETYFARACLKNPSRPPNAPPEIFLDSWRLLPRHMKSLYGFSGNNVSCHEVAALYNDHDESLFVQFDNATQMRTSLYSSLPRGERPQFGDHIFIHAAWGKTADGMRIVDPGDQHLMHTAVYVAPGLVLSKNGGGQDIPLYLQPMAKVVALYSHYFMRAGNRSDNTLYVDVLRRREKS